MKASIHFLQTGSKHTQRNMDISYKAQNKMNHEPFTWPCKLGNVKTHKFKISDYVCVGGGTRLREAETVSWFLSISFHKKYFPNVLYLNIIIYIRKVISPALTGFTCITLIQ